MSDLKKETRKLQIGVCGFFINLKSEFLNLNQNINLRKDICSLQELQKFL